MDEENSEEFEAVALQCFACATRDAEKRAAAQAQRASEYGDGAFDGLYVFPVRRSE